MELPFPFPCIIKASNSVAYWNCKFPHKKKVFVAYNKEEFDAITAAIYCCRSTFPATTTACGC